MSQPNHYYLEPVRYAELLDILQNDARLDVVRRAQALQLLHLGHSMAEVSTLTGAGRTTLWEWHSRFLEAGAEGLHDKPRSGRPPKVGTLYVEELERTLEAEPAAHGYAFSIWTNERLCAHLHTQTGIQVSVRTMGGLLRRLGYVYRRPKYDPHHLQDPAAVATARENLEALKGGRVQEHTNSSLWTKPPATATPTSASAG